jgi:sterol desaturase/sphingolipid hydroxylase (fatty acid hydroxylase superfamily)
MSLAVTIPATIVIAAWLWSFTEYAMHNWNGHLLKGRTDFSREHLAHHTNPEYMAPDWKKAKAAIIVSALLTPAAIWLLGTVLGLIFSVSYIGAYLYYEALHLHAHKAGPKTRYGRWVRKHHFAHHFNSPKYNHGVTSPLWDWVFGTLKPVDKVRVPERAVMVWLCDPQTGEVYPEFANDYQLMHPHQKSTEVAA